MQDLRDDDDDGYSNSSELYGESDGSDGNGEWMAAFDAPSAYMLVHMHHYPDKTPQAQPKAPSPVGVIGLPSPGGGFSTPVDAGVLRVLYLPPRRRPSTPCTRSLTSSP